MEKSIEAKRDRMIGPSLPISDKACALITVDGKKSFREVLSAADDSVADRKVHKNKVSRKNFNTGLLSM